MTANILNLLNGERVKVTVSLFGRQTTLSAIWNSYHKPFIELIVKGVTRLINENCIREIIPMEATQCKIAITKSVK